MTDSTATLIERVRSIMPDLKIEHIECVREGVINDVAIVNQELVFRFAKSEEYASLLEVEAGILNFIRPHLTIDVPKPIYIGTGCMVYPLLRGQQFTLKAVQAFDEQTQRYLARQLGSFLFQMHSLNITNLDAQLPVTRAYVTREEWIRVQEEVKSKVFPLLEDYQIEWAEDLFMGVLENPETFKYVPAFIHGDLASCHILYDVGKEKITGIIDFSMAGIGDPASDIGHLINIYGETFVQKMHQAYPDLDILLPRARFYAPAMELEWILRGLETGATFWFTGHLASARDIRTSSLKSFY